MNTDMVTAALDLRSEINREILLVGKQDELLNALPSLGEQLLACPQLRICGELASSDPATELWQRILTCQPDRLWIVGGDGTINLVGQCALRAEWKWPCWLTPAGTANDLARALADHSSYCAVPAGTNVPSAILQPTINVDLLSVKLDNNPWVRCAANMFTLGTSARNTHHVTTEIKARWGAFAYLTQAWRAMGDLEPFDVHIEVGKADVRSVANVLNIFVANGPYCGGGFRVAPTAKIDDQLFDVVVLKKGTTAELAHLATTFFTGNYLEHPLVEHFTTNRLSIRCAESSPLTVDGEAFNASTILIESGARSLPINLVTGN